MPQQMRVAQHQNDNISRVSASSAEPANKYIAQEQDSTDQTTKINSNEIVTHLRSLRTQVKQTDENEMNQQDREYLEAKLAASSERAEGRYDLLSEKMNGISDRIGLLLQSTAEIGSRVDRLEGKVDSKVDAMNARIDALGHAQATTKWTLFVTVITVSLAVVALVWSSNTLILDAAGLKSDERQQSDRQSTTGRAN